MRKDEDKSCLRLFDEMQLCFTIAPQVKNYYIHGKWKDCELQRSRFMNCISANNVKIVRPRKSIGIWQVKNDLQE